MDNPFESPSDESLRPNSASELKQRYGRKGVESADFVRIGTMMQIIGGSILLLALLLLFMNLIIGGVTALVGACFFIPGRGLFTYRRWAWYAAVFVALPLSILPTIAAVVLTLFGIIRWQLLLFPVMFGWVAWVLLSNSGRDRYRVLCDAVEKRKSRGKHTPEYHDIEPSPFPAEDAAQPEIDPFASAGDGS